MKPIPMRLISQSEGMDKMQCSCSHTFWYAKGHRNSVTFDGGETPTAICPNCRAVWDGILVSSVEPLQEHFAAWTFSPAGKRELFALSRRPAPFLDFMITVLGKLDTERVKGVIFERVTDERHQELDTASSFREFVETIFGGIPK